MPAAPLPTSAPAYVEASKPPSAADVEAGATAAAAAPPPAAAVPGAALADDAAAAAAKADEADDPYLPTSAAAAAGRRRGCGLSAAFVGWMLFAMGWLLSLIWVVGLPVANASPQSCGAQAQRLMASGNPLAQLVQYDRLRALMECRIVTNVALTAAGASCLVPWLLGSLLPCCCTSRRALARSGNHCAALAAAKSRRSRAAAANTVMSVLALAALAGLIAMCATEYREAKKSDTPEARAQLESASRAAQAGQQAATAIDGLIEQVGQALGIPPPPGVGSAASGDGLLGRLFKP